MTSKGVPEPADRWVQLIPTAFSDNKVALAALPRAWICRS